jgi:DNA-binding MarR family transcriptional regulator
MSSTLLTNAYLRFVRLTETLDASPSFPKLDHVEKKLLEFIALNEAAGKNLLVSDVIYANEIGSPATLHRRISQLEKLDLIRYAADIDGRKKCVQLTPKAHDYWSKLGKCIAKAASGVNG